MSLVKNMDPMPICMMVRKKLNELQEDLYRTFILLSDTIWFISSPYQEHHHYHSTIEQTTSSDCDDMIVDMLLFIGS